MAYTIKGLAKANECESLDEYGLAELWKMWYICNCGGRKDIIADFKRLRKEDRRAMLHFMQGESLYKDLFNYIVEHI